MLELIGVENMKIYRRSRTWTMLGILVLAVVLVAVVTASRHQAASGDWKHTLSVQNSQIERQLHSGAKMPSAAVSQLKAQLRMNQYDIAHNHNPTQTTGWGFVATAEHLSPLLIAFVVVIAGDIVAGEFGAGTVKMLLTQTATRTEILLAKYLAMLLFSLFATALLFAASVLAGWIFFGTAGAGAPHVYVNAQHGVSQMSTATFLLMQYGFLMIQVVVTATIAFMISSIFRSSALAITVSLLAFLVGSALVQALSGFGWVKYILFANTNLSQFVVNGPMISGLTLQFSIVVLVGYYLVMNALAWGFFVRRDVT